MYQISYDGITRAFITMGDLLVFMNEEKDADGAKAFRPARELRPAGDIVVTINDKPVLCVRNAYGSYGIQQEGSAFDLLLRMLDEVELYYVKQNYAICGPHEMLRSRWAAVVAIGKAAYNVYPCFSAEQQHETREIESRNGDSYNAGLSSFCEHMFFKRFGYGHNGPAYDHSGQTNSRHEVHVAYALAAGKFVPEEVLEEYLANEDAQGKYDVKKWFKVLLEFPQLRGRMPPEKLDVLSNILAHENIQFTVENVSEYVRLMAEIPDDPTHVQVDDLLYSKGILPARSVDKPPVIVDLSTAFSPLALHIRQLIGEWRQKAETQRIDEERSRGNISLRVVETAKIQIARIVDEEPLEWANKMARAVEELNIDLLLHVLDTPDDSNTMSKKAIKEQCGLKLLGLKAKDRRDAIFAFCGYDSEKRRQYEKAILDQANKDSELRASKEAENRASQSKWRVDGGKVVSGKEYVDAAVAEGYTVIATSRKGRALQYWLKNPAKGASRNILAKDGTLDYARLVLGLEEERKAA